MASGCGSSPSATTFLSREDMLEPNNCAGCHVSHLNDWSESMHAKATDDPRAGYFMDPRELAGSGHASCGPSILVIEAAKHGEGDDVSPRQRGPRGPGG
jgi:hypothetical protein